MASEPVAWRWYCRASEDFEYLDNERGDFDAYRAAHPQTTFRPLYDEATLSSQEAEIERLKTALEPFAKLDMPAADKWTCGTFLIEHADIRRARAALTPLPEGGQHG